jgi:hypothetical protein
MKAVFLKFYKKFKIFINGGIIIFVIFQAHDILVTCLYATEMGHSVLPEVMNSILGIPYYENDQMHNDYPDIVKIPKEDWFKFKCKPRPYQNGQVFQEIRAKKHLSDNDVLRLKCLGIEQVRARDSRKSKSINGELCNNVFNCRVINIAVTPYVLDNQEILWSMLKIAERPCDYVKKSENYNPEYDYEYRDLRPNLHCDGVRYPWYRRERVFVIITVRDLENKRIADFIVRRQDLD